MNLLLLSALFLAPLDTATFAGGCFWTMEHAFDELPGVTSVTVGFMGGTAVSPSYQQVVNGGTGHLESVQVVYDPAKIRYAKLLDAFWHNIDPFQVNGQACDHGGQYQTAIFYRDSVQQRLAEQTKRQLGLRFQRPIATQLRAAGGGRSIRPRSTTSTTTRRIRSATGSIARAAAGTGFSSRSGAPTHRAPKEPS